MGDGRKRKCGMDLEQNNGESSENILLGRMDGRYRDRKSDDEGEK